MERRPGWRAQFGVDFEQQCRYNRWANERSALSIQELPRPGRSGQMFAHLIAATRIWIERCAGRDCAVPVWPAWDHKQACEEMQSAHADLATLAAGGGLDRRFWYANSAGLRFENSVGEVLAHVLMHSMYHRGQIALLVKAEGGQSAVTDYIAYLRQ